MTTREILVRESSECPQPSVTTLMILLRAFWKKSTRVLGTILGRKTTSMPGGVRVKKVSTSDGQGRSQRSRQKKRKILIKEK
jgi:hypothetical protein